MLLAAAGCCTTQTQHSICGLALASRYRSAQGLGVGAATRDRCDHVCGGYTEEQGGRQSPPQLCTWSPYPPAVGLLLSQIPVPAGVPVGFCPATDTRRTHARANAHGLALIHVVSTTDKDCLGSGYKEGGGQNQKGGPSSNGPDYLLLRQAWGVPILIGRFFRCCLLPSRICH